MTVRNEFRCKSTYSLYTHSVINIIYTLRAASNNTECISAFCDYELTTSYKDEVATTLSALNIITSPVIIFITHANTY